MYIYNVFIMVTRKLILPNKMKRTKRLYLIRFEQFSAMINEWRREKNRKTNNSNDYREFWYRSKVNNSINFGVRTEVISFVGRIHIAAWPGLMIIAKINANSLNPLYFSFFFFCGRKCFNPQPRQNYGAYRHKHTQSISIRTDFDSREAATRHDRVRTIFQMYRERERERERAW